MNQTETPLSIATVREGAVIEAVDEALLDIYRNIMDPNTDPEDTRKITLTISIKPNSDRNEIDLTFRVKSQPAGQKPLAARSSIGGNSAKAMAVEWRDRQRTIDQLLVEQHTTPRVVAENKE